MNPFSGGLGQRTLPEGFLLLRGYNAAYPKAAFPDTPEGRAVLRRFDAAGQGVEDDICRVGGQMSIDFLPGGAPGRDEPDRVGNVVAIAFGQGPVYVLAVNLPLRAASETVTAQWPTTLSTVSSALGDLCRYGTIR